MLFKRDVLRRIQAGEVTAALRRWRRPSVKAGGTLKTAVGVLRIESVERIEPASITDALALQAGHTDAAAARSQLSRGAGDVYQIRFRVAGADPRIALAAQGDLDDRDWQDVARRLARMDGAAVAGPWTRQTLELIEAHEGVRAGELAARLGRARDAFKRNVRKLKNLGLTESLATGYRLSARGQAVLARLRDPA